MSNELIQQLASGIRGSEESAALAKRHELHRAEVIRATAPRFIEELNARLEASGEQLNAALQGSASADFPVKSQRNANNLPFGFGIKKEKFPSASAELTYMPQGLSVRVVLTPAKPLPGAGSAKRLDAQWRIDLDADGRLSLVVPPGAPGKDELRLDNPTAAADYIMQAIFSV